MSDKPVDYDPIRHVAQITNRPVRMMPLPPMIGRVERDAEEDAAYDAFMLSDAKDWHSFVAGWLAHLERGRTTEQLEKQERRRSLMGQDDRDKEDAESRE